MPGSPPFLWTGNHPATDLCNTEPVIDGERVELLPDYDSVVSWAHGAGITSPGGSFDATDREAAQTLRFVRRLRAGLRGGARPDHRRGGHDPRFERGLLEAPRRPACRTVVRRAVVSLAAATPAAQLRLDIAAATLDIFRHDPGRVRRCAGPTCVLLFLDVSKSGRRRWCDMAVCGNPPRSPLTTHASSGS